MAAAAGFSGALCSLAEASGPTFAPAAAAPYSGGADVIQSGTLIVSIGRDGQR